MKYNKQLRLFLLAIVLSTPIAAETASPEASAGEQSQSHTLSEDNLLMPSKEKLCKILRDAGIISHENAKAIIAASVELSNFPYGIRVKYKSGQIVFGSNSEIMANIQKRYKGNENAAAQAAERYIEELAEAVGEADMILRTVNSSDVKMGIISDWACCVEVSVQNLLLKKNISLNEAMDWFARTSKFHMIRKYVEWDEKIKVFRIKDDVFNTDFGG